MSPSRLAPRALGLPLLTALLVACAPVGPDYQPPEQQLPAAWSEAGEGAPTSAEVDALRWWTLFHDAQLNRLIEQAVRSNPDLRVGESRLREARALRVQAAAGGLPALDATGSATSARRSDNTGSSTGGTSQDLFTIGFDAGWELDFFGGVRRQVEAAEAAVEAASQDQRVLLVTLTAEVADSYIQLRASQQRLAIVRDTVRLQEQTVDLVRSKMALGLGSQLEVLQAETQLALTRAEAPSLDRDAVQAMHRLALLLGREPQSLKTDLSVSTTLPPVPPQLPLALPSDLLRQRPDIRAAERRLAAATATVGAAVAELFPRFSLAALVGLQSQNLSDLVTSASRFWTVGPSVRWPLFDAGRARADVTISEARRDRAQAEYEKAVLAALAEVEDSLAGLNREREKQLRLAEAVGLARQALAVAQGQYRSGLTTFLNVLLAEASLFQAQDRLAQSSQHLALQTIALYKALGAGWPTVPPPSSPQT